jgi:tetratricopeptide (TPR) repeat protein
MLAIANSWGTKPDKAFRLPHKFGFLAFVKRWIVAGCIIALVCLAPRAQADFPTNQPADQASFAQRAEKAFTEAKSKFETQTNNAEAKWQFGRACYDWADFSTSDKQRADIAKQGIAACRKLIEQNGESAPGHYYLAMNLGQLAQTKSLGALRIVSQMEAEFKIAVSLDPKLDFAGPDRSLGLLYFQAPGWPASIGSKSKARQHLQKALKLFPNYPGNALNMIEAELKWGERREAARALDTLDPIWSAAQKELAGDQWAPSWADWDRRRKLAEEKAASSRKTAAAPRKSGQN